MEGRIWKYLRSVKKEILVLLPLVTRSAVSLFHTVSCLMLLMHPSLLAIILVSHSQILVDQTIILLLVLTLGLPVTPVVRLVTTPGSVLKGLPDAMISRQRRMTNLKVLDVVVTHVTVEEAQEDPHVILGTLRVNSILSVVLFDSGASHTFISQEFAREHGINFEEMSSPI